MGDTAGLRLEVDDPKDTLETMMRSSKVEHARKPRFAGIASDRNVHVMSGPVE